MPWVARTCGQQCGRGVEGHGGHGGSVHGPPGALTAGLPPAPAAQQQRPARRHQHLGMARELREARLCQPHTAQHSPRCSSGPGHGCV